MYDCVLAKKDLGANTVDLQQGAVGVAVGLAALVASVSEAQKAVDIDVLESAMRSINCAQSSSPR